MDQCPKKILKEIKMWLWISSVIPLSSLAGLFFIWAFGTDNLLHITMVVGATAMFTVAVIWWFWALHTIKLLINHWDQTKDRVLIILHEVKSVREILKDVIPKKNDK